MMICKTRKWGNSIGIILPKEELDRMHITEDEDVVVDVKRKDNPLKELFGAGKALGITQEEFRRFRKGWESKLI